MRHSPVDSRGDAASCRWASGGGRGAGSDSCRGAGRETGLGGDARDSRRAAPSPPAPPGCLPRVARGERREVMQEKRAAGSKSGDFGYGRSGTRQSSGWFGSKAEIPKSGDFGYVTRRNCHTFRYRPPESGDVPFPKSGDFGYGGRSAHEAAGCRCYTRGRPTCVAAKLQTVRRGFWSLARTGLIALALVRFPATIPNHEFESSLPAPNSSHS